jgi:predicted O-methyltransferase YrrM
MISVYTASIAQKVDKINIWYTEVPEGIYFEAIRPLVNLIDMRDRYKTPLRALQNKDPGFQHAHIKDHMQWEILSTHGGLYLDMDTVSIMDITDLMTDEYTLFASLEMEDSYAIPFPFNGAVVCVNPDKLDDPANPVRTLNKNVVGLFNESDMMWGITGPILLSMIINERRAIFGEDKCGIRIVPHTVFCPRNGYYIKDYYEENVNLEIPPETCIIHLFAKASGSNFDKVDAEWVRSSNSTLARLIRNIVPESVWGIKPGWNATRYLAKRGQHYAGLFRAIQEFKPRTILEIGTSAGETAIEMIKCAGLNHGEEDLEYYGVDLFEIGKPEQWANEFTGGYIPPKMDDVRKKLESETKAQINLMAVDSRNLLQYDIDKWPELDLIFIDGGHSLETVKKDWEFVQMIMNPGTIVVFDDHFPEMEFIGAKVTVDGIDRSKYEVKIQPEVDDYTHPFGRLRDQLVVVTFRQPDAPREIKKDWAKVILEKVIGG